MLSIQHVMSMVLATNNDKEYVDKHIASVVFPDAIRAYSGPRGLSHFEKGTDGSSSYWKFPTGMKTVTKESVDLSLALDSYLAAAPKAFIGEESDIEAFRKHNRHLPKEMYEGCEAHLKQDIIFDNFIREKIDCKEKYKDRFFIISGKGEREEIDGKTLRNIIANIEQQGVYILAYEIYERTGTLINQQWFDEVVYPALKRDYPEDLAEKTYSYMKIHPMINELITNKDWSKLDKIVVGNIRYKDFKKLYNDATNYLHTDKDMKKHYDKNINYLDK